MASSYPAGLDNFAINRVDTTPNATTQAADHNDHADAINKIEAELGINPRGSRSTVSAAISVLEKATDVVVALGSGDFTTIQAAIDGTVGPIRILVSNDIYALGGNGITIPAGRDGIVICGEAKGGTIITYTGTGSAITVGTSSGDTRYIHLENLWIQGSSSGRSGLRLNRVKNSHFRSIRTTGFTSTSSPGTGIHLDGTNSYTGDNYFYDIHVDTCQEGIQFLSASNANYFFGGTIRTTQGDPNARGINFTTANGNAVYGFDIETCTTGVRVGAGGANNAIFGFRFEAVTNAIILESGADNFLIVAPIRASGTVTNFITDNATNTIIVGATGYISNAILRSTASSRPVAGVLGRLHHATDTNVLSRDNGSTWDTLGILMSGSAQTYTVTNGSIDRAYDANSTSLNEIADVLGTLISDLQARGILAS